MPKPGRTFLAMVCVSTLCLGGCAVSPSTGNATLHGYDNGVHDAQSQQSDRDDYDDMRAAELPLAPKTIADVPFDVWVSEGSIPDDLVIGGADRPTRAKEGRQFHVLGSTRGKTDAQVLTLIDGGVAFGTGTSPQVSRETVGLIGTEGKFTALQEVPNVGDGSTLSGDAPFESLNATGASSWGQVVVWVAVGTGGKQWALVGWNVETGQISELATAESMTLGFTGISARMVPGLEPPKVNGGYAYFEVAIPQNVYDAATPGVRFHEIQVSGESSPDYGVAVFRVPLDSPGDVVFVGPSAQVIADPVIDRGMFWAAAPSSDIDSLHDGTLRGDLEQNQSGSGLGTDNAAQSGQWDPLAGLESFNYSNLLEVAAGKQVHESKAPDLVVWRNASVISPLLGFGPANDWVISDLEASQRYLVVALTKMSVVRGEEQSSSDGPPAWLVAWDMETGRVAGLAKSEVAVPNLSVSGDMVAWGAGADLSQATSDAIGNVSVEGASDGFVWQIGSDVVFQLPSEDVVVPPQISGHTIAVRQVDSEGVSGWTFLRWITD